MFRNTTRSWGLVSILFHWVMAALFLCQFGLGWYMVGLTNIRDVLEQYNLYQLHKSIGFTILGLATLRFAWALSSRTPKLPEAMPESERQLAHGAHIALYIALFAVPLTGWAVVSTSTLPVATWYFHLFVIPSLPLGISGSAKQMWTSIHGFLAYTAIFLAAVHILAAFRHHFHHKDAVLLRMLRPGYEGEERRSD